jgi:hypothetical protein
MKPRIFYVVLSLFVGVAAITLLIAAASFAASAAGPFTMDNRPHAAETQNDVTILARRVISIPFGIDDSLGLSEDGQTVAVAGHGDCVGGETFWLKVTVSQDSLNGLAVGFMEGVCASDGEVSWSVDVNTPGSKSFSTGDAQACGHVVVYFDHEGAIAHDWCKPVTLE